MKPPGTYRTLLLVSLAALAALPACDRRSEKERPLVVLIGRSAADPQWGVIKTAAEHVANGYPHIRLAVVDGDGQETLAELIAAAEDRDPAAVVLWLPDGQIDAAAVEALDMPGVIVLTAGQRLAEPVGSAHIELQVPEGLAELGRALPEVAKPGRSYVLVHAAASSPTAERRYALFRETAVDVLSVVMLDERQVAPDRAAQADAIEQLVQRFEHVALVVTLEPDVWLATDLRPALPVGTRFVTAGPLGALAGDIRDGRCAAVVSAMDGEVGQIMVELAAEYLLPEPGRPPDKRFVPTHVVTADNLDTFLDRYEAARTGAAAPAPAP